MSRVFIRLGGGLESYYWIVDTKIKYDYDHYGLFEYTVYDINKPDLKLQRIGYLTTFYDPCFKEISTEELKKAKLVNSLDCLR